MFQAEPPFEHDKKQTLGILMLNLGTPDEPTAPALRRYLKQFLWDRRVVEMPRWLWWLILNGIILNVRPRKSAAAYSRVWTEQGSPLYRTSAQLAEKVQKQCNDSLDFPVKVELGMSYGNPSIAHALADLKAAGARHILVLPLYPQYSATTTAATFDAITAELRNWRWLPELRFINQYHDRPLYIQALVDSIRVQWEKNGKSEKLLFSFHGTPKRYHSAGDPYYCQCHKTARLVAEHLALDRAQWDISFQSIFGKEEWLKPYTQALLEQWGAKGIKSVDIICPGFSADCLETLEEINMEVHEAFIQAGGKSFNYIPCLNDNEDHVQLMMALISTHTQGWECTASDYEAYQEAALLLRQQRAQDLGADE